MDTVECARRKSLAYAVASSFVLQTMTTNPAKVTAYRSLVFVLVVSFMLLPSVSSALLPCHGP
jgi:hypothetical protein